LALLYKEYKNESKRELIEKGYPKEVVPYY